ncbi:hypothetical protein L873DRAFT_1811918, partial [Choiromyces venosus 120613-1]
MHNTPIKYPSTTHPRPRLPHNLHQSPPATPKHNPIPTHSSKKNPTEPASPTPKQPPSCG